MENQPMVIEVFADVACPFTHAGLKQLVARRAELGRNDLTLSVRAWPLEYVNGKPLDATFIAEEIVALQEQVTPELFQGFDEAAFPATSVPAMALAAAAYRRSVSVGEEVSLALRDLLFEQGVDIADEGELAKLAARHDLTVTDADRASVSADHAEGIDRDVVGSPHFFTPSGGFFCPSLDVSRDDDDELHVSTDNEGFNRFLAACMLN